MSSVSGRWLQWQTALMNLAARQTPRSVALEKPLGQKDRSSCDLENHCTVAMG